MRLAIRNEGMFINAYLAPDADTLYGAETVASLKTHVAREHPVVFEAWKATLQILADHLHQPLMDELGEALNQEGESNDEAAAARRAGGGALFKRQGKHRYIKFLPDNARHLRQLQKSV